MRSFKLVNPGGLGVVATMLVAAVFAGFATISAVRAADILIVETMTLGAIQERTEALKAYLFSSGCCDVIERDVRVINIEKDRAHGADMIRAALAAKRPDLVISIATVATQAARDVLKGEPDIPQVFQFVSDPVGAGVIDEIGVPTHSNLAGHVHLVPTGIHLNMVMRLIGQKSAARPVRIGIIHSTYPSSVGMVRKLQKAVAERGDVLLVPYEVEQLTNVSGMSEMTARSLDGLVRLKDRVDFFWIAEGPLGRDDGYVAAMLRAAPKPVVSAPSVEAAKLGALVVLDSSLKAEAEETGMLVTAIVKGQDPATVPVMRSSAYRVGLNLETAKKLGIDVPADLRRSAGDNVF